MLYALPDHEVMESLLPDIRRRHLGVDEAVAAIQATPGLVPIAINPADGGLVYFADIGDVPLMEWKYIYTVERLAKEGAITNLFTTDLAVLDRDNLVPDGLLPQGFLSHVSRCGSTLLTKSLARSPRNVSINQGGPLQEGFWAVATENWQHMPQANARNIRMFRNIVLLMSRKRRPEYVRCFLKFISWNVIFLDFIRAAFPEVPIIYLYRNPAEVIVNVLKETTAVLRVKGTHQAVMLTGLEPAVTAAMSNVEYLAHCYNQYFRLADKACTDAGNVQLLNYSSLRHRENYQDILARGFNFHPDADELALMAEQFRYYSKDDSDKVMFRPDADNLGDALGEADRKLVDRICRDSFARLNTSRHNLFPVA